MKCIQQRFSYALAGVIAFIAAPLSAEPVVFEGVTLIPMDEERVLENQTVVVNEGRIVAIGDSDMIKAPVGAQVIAGEGRYLMPGLSDMHAHIAGYELDSTAAADTRALARNQFLLYLAGGVTLLRDTGGSPGHVDYARQIESGELLGPDFFFTSRILEGEDAVWDFSTKVTEVEQVEPLIASFAENGYWGVKVYHTLSDPVYRAIMETAAHYELPVVGHVPFETGIEEVLKLGQFSIEHLRGYDFDGVDLAHLKETGGRTPLRFGAIRRMSEARRTELVALTKASGTWNTPTLAVNRLMFDAKLRASLAEHPRFGLLHPAIQETVNNFNGLDAIFLPETKQALAEAYEPSQALVKALDDAGAGLLVGTDSSVPAYLPGFTVIDEIKSFVDAGISPYSALKAATIAPAQSLGIADTHGTVAVGKVANLLLLEANPLDDVDALWRLEGVVIGGRWYRLTELEALLRADLAELENDASE